MPKTKKDSNGNSRKLCWASIKAKISHWTERINQTSKTFIVILSILGLVSFTLFIFEEAFQTTMFGTWIAQDAANWGLCKEGADIMSVTNQSLKYINYGIGWIHPLAFLSYRAYSQAADYYVKSLRIKAFVNAPELFTGEEIEFFFQPKKVEKISGGVKLINGKVAVILDKIPESRGFWVKGKVEFDGEYLTIKSKERR